MVLKAWRSLELTVPSLSQAEIRATRIPNRTRKSESRAGVRRAPSLSMRVPGYSESDSQAPSQPERLRRAASTQSRNSGALAVHLEMDS